MGWRGGGVTVVMWSYDTNLRSCAMLLALSLLWPKVAAAIALVRT